jgi:hypothetical protein
MEFNALVKTQLFPILQKYGFEIEEEFKIFYVFNLL